MASQAEELAHQLGASDVPAKQRLRSLRAVRNQVISNRSKKVAFLQLGAVRAVVQLLQHTSDVEAIVQAITTIGSLAYDVAEGAREVVECGGFAKIVELCLSSDARVMEAAVRTLKMLLHPEDVPRAPVMAEAVRGRIVSLLSPDAAGGDTVSQHACEIVRRCCLTREMQGMWVQSGATGALVHLMGSARVRVSIAAATAVGAMVCANEAAARDVLRCPRLEAAVIGMLQSHRPDARLEACRLVRRLAGALSSGPSHSEGSHAPGSHDTTFSTLVLHASQALLRLLSEGPLRTDRRAFNPDAAEEMAALWSSSPTLQWAPMDAETLTTLTGIIHEGPSPPTPAAAHNLSCALHALAALCTRREEARRAVLDRKVAPILLRAIESTDASVRVAACKCLVSLARSSAILMQAFKDASPLRPLFAALKDGHREVVLEASAALCNLVTFGDAVKSECLGPHGLGRMMELVTGADVELRRNALLFLKNLAFDAGSAIKAGILDAAPWATLVESLLSDEDRRVQECTWGVLRNIANCVGGSQGRDADLVLRAVPWPVLAKHLERQLEEGAVRPLGDNEGKVLEHALYFVVNIAGSLESARQTIIESTVPARIKALLLAGHAPPPTLVAALWILLNLVYWKGSLVGDSALHRTKSLLHTGMADAVRAVAKHGDQDVRDRAAQVLEEMRARRQATLGGPGQTSGSDDEMMGPVPI